MILYKSKFCSFPLRWGSRNLLLLALSVFLCWLDRNLLLGSSPPIMQSSFACFFGCVYCWFLCCMVALRGVGECWESYPGPYRVLRSIAVNYDSNTCVVYKWWSLYYKVVNIVTSYRYIQYCWCSGMNSGFGILHSLLHYTKTGDYIGDLYWSPIGC